MLRENGERKNGEEEKKGKRRPLQVRENLFLRVLKLNNEDEI